MKQVRFTDPSGYIRVGEWQQNGVTFDGQRYDLSEIGVLPPVEPTKIVAVGRNYRDAIDELDATVPDQLRLFFKPPHTVVGHSGSVMLPDSDHEVVYEAELGVVIGEQCRNVPAADAMEKVMGFTCVNDISNLSVMDADPGGVRTKGFDTAAPLGPVIATPADVPFEDASITLRLNGDVRQQSTTASMIATIPEMVHEISKICTLEAGDVISTGTPAGIGTLSDGDSVEIEIEGIGTLVHDVRTPN